MKILMIDVGGTNVKLMASDCNGWRKVPSGRKLSAKEMVKEVLDATRDWEYDLISLGFPGMVVNGAPIAEPLNLGGGWKDFDFQAAFQRPVRIINDAAMQALASYQDGRMLFLGFGTSVGATVIADDVIVPLEIGMLRLKNGARFMERVSAKAYKRDGHRKWMKAVSEVVSQMRDVVKPTDIVLGGGNAKEMDPLPHACRRRDNQHAFVGARRLWEGADLLASPYGTSWRISRHVVVG